MPRFPRLLPLAIVLALAGCAVPLSPVEVTRFHLPETSALGHGTLAVVAAPAADPASLEQQGWQALVGERLVALGYTAAPADRAQQIATVAITRETSQPGPASQPPVRVGLSGATGSYGSGLGLGLSFNLAGKSAAQVTTQLAVTIRDRASGATLWEGRSRFTVAATSPYADGQLAGAQLASALFAGFPGQSGETVTVQPPTR
jgi:hypothetical protein